MESAEWAVNQYLRDPWVPGFKKIELPNRENMEELGEKNVDFLMDEYGQWVVQKLRDLFSPRAVTEVLKIQLSTNHRPDTFIFLFLLGRVRSYPHSSLISILLICSHLWQKNHSYKESQENNK